MKSVVAALAFVASAQALAFVTCVPADQEAAQNLTCVHLARMSERNAIVQKPLFVQTADKKLVRAMVNYHTDGNRSHFLIESRARSFSVNIDFRSADWDTTRGIQPDAFVSVFDSRSLYDGKFYCSSKLSMDFIRERCPDLSKRDERMLKKELDL